MKLNGIALSLLVACVLISGSLALAQDTTSVLISDSIPAATAAPETIVPDTAQPMAAPPSVPDTTQHIAVPPPVPMPRDMEVSDTAKAAAPKTKESLVSLDSAKAGLKHYSLEGLVVTTHRYEKSGFKVPNTVLILDQDRIQKNNPDVVTDMFRTLPSVDLVDAGPFAPRPIIRGLFGSRILLLVDGERLNDTRESPFSGAQLSLLDVDEIERVEVVNGPGVVLYGTDALGGVVNVITHRALFADEVQRASGAKVKLRYSSVDEQFKGNLGFRYAKYKWALALGAGTRSATDYETPETTVVNSAAHASNFDVKLGYKLNDNHKVYADYQRLEATNVGFPNTPNPIFPVRFFYPERSRDKVAVTYEGRNISKSMPLMKAKVYYQSLQKDFDAYFGSAQLSRTTTDVKTLGASFQELFLLPPYQLLTWGLDYYRENVQGGKKSYFPFADSTPVVPEVNWDVAGVYVQDEITLSKKATLQAGARYEYAKSTPQSTSGLATLPPVDTDKFASLSLGAIYRLRPELALHANLARAFRNPNVVEKYFSGPGSGGTWVVPNDSLKKEKGVSVDLGIKANLENMALSLNFFLSEYKDFIDLRPTGGLVMGMPAYQWQNLEGTTRIDGLEAVWEGDFTDEFYGFANASYLFGHQRSDSTATVPYFVTPFKIYFGIGWKEGETGRMWAEVAGRVVDKQDRVPAGFSSTSGFGVFDIRGGFKLTNHINASLGIRNLTDQDYIEPANQFNVSNPVPEPGRSFVFGLTISTD